MSHTVVACCQLVLQVGDPAGNRAACRDAVIEAAQRGADVVVLPELANSGYVFADRAEARRDAEPPDGTTTSEWIALAREHGLLIAGGLCECDAASGRLHNSAVLVDPSGLRAVYRKAHLWDRELEVFEPGERPPPVIETRHGRISVMVCYDLEFPEWVHLAAREGADLLCAPTNWPRSPRPAGERPAEVVRVQADAAVNRMFVAASDRAGHERGVDWVNGTVIVGPDGYPLAGPVGEDAAVTILARCRLGEARQKQISARNDVLRDRRPELYR